MPGLELGLRPGAAGGRRRPGFAFGSGLPPGAVLTRRAAAAYWTAAGILARAGQHAARFEYDPGSGHLRGLVIEPGGANLLPWAGGIEAWAERHDCTVAGGVAGSPDGEANWGRIVPVPGAGRTPWVADASVSKAVGATYTLSVYLGHETVRWAWLSGDAPAAARGAWFDLATGTVGTVGANVLAATIAPAGPGRWRAAVTFTGTDSDRCVLAPVTADGAFGGDYAAGDGMLAWGMMLETGSSATSLIASAGGAANRAADRLQLDWGSQGVADGAATVRYGFDDGSHQDVAIEIVDGAVTVPTGLARRWLRRADLF